MTPIKISNSEIQTFKDCQRKWWLVYYRELGRKRSELSAVGPRELGSRFHTILHVMYTEPDADPMQVLSDLYDADAEEYFKYDDGEDRIKELRKEQDLAHAMLSGFIEWRAEEGLDYGMTMIAAESIVEIPMVEIAGTRDRPEVILRGKLDQRWMREVDGTRLFRDWKTVQSVTEPAKILPMDEQMKFYHLLEYMDSMNKNGGKEPEWRTDGALYTMIRKVKRGASAKPPFYAQLEVHHNMHELRSMWKRVIRTVTQIVATRQELDDGGDPLSVVPPRPSRDCTWKCDFFLVCNLFDDGSNAEGLLAEHYVHLDPHERYNAEDTGREVTT